LEAQHRGQRRSPKENTRDFSPVMATAAMRTIAKDGGTKARIYQLA
jgi:hypothetical protein